MHAITNSKKVSAKRKTMDEKKSPRKDCRLPKKNKTNESDGRVKCEVETKHCYSCQKPLVKQYLTRDYVPIPTWERCEYADGIRTRIWSCPSHGPVPWADAVRRGDATVPDLTLFIDMSVLGILGKDHNSHVKTFETRFPKHNFHVRTYLNAVLWKEILL